MPKLPSVKASRNTSPAAPFFTGNACMHVMCESHFSACDAHNQRPYSQRVYGCNTSPPQSPVEDHLHTVLSSLADRMSPDALHATPAAA